MCQACLLVLLYSIMHEQGISEIEDGAFFEDEQHMKLSARGAEIFWWYWGAPLRFSERGRMHVCVRILHSQKAVLPCDLFLPFTYVHVVAFLSRRHAPESGRGDDEATGNTQLSREYFGDRGDIAACNHACVRDIAMSRK